MHKLQKILVILFGATLLIIVGITAGAVFYANEARESYELSNDAYERQLMLDSTFVALLQAESSQRALLITGNPLYLQDHQERREQVAALLRRFEQAAADTSLDPEQVAQLGEQVAQRMALMEQINRSLREGGPELAAESLHNFEGRSLMAQIRETVAQLAAAERELLQQRDAAIVANASHLINLLVAGVLLNVLLLSGALFVTRRSVLHGERLMERLHHTSQDIRNINQLSSSLQSCKLIDESAAVLQHYMHRLFPEVRGGLYLMRASRNMLQLSASWNTGDKPLPDPIEPQDCWALRLGRSYVVSEGDSDIPCRHRQTTDTSLCIPLMAQSDIVGLLSLEVPDRAQLSQVRERAELTATHISSALASINLRQALHQQSIRDALTGLFNRRYLEESLDRELLRAERRGTSLSVVMVDIDRFKQFNDDYGHQAGDLLLKEFGEYIRRHVRGEDIPCRYGGEEFLLALPGASAREAHDRAEEIRQNLMSLRLTFQGKVLPTVTASFGIASFPEHAAERDALVRLADAALYIAKRSGRDRVVVSGEIQGGDNGS